jgi:hypothetical protein
MLIDSVQLLRHGFGVRIGGRGGMPAAEAVVLIAQMSSKRGFIFCEYQWRWFGLMLRFFVLEFLKSAIAVSWVGRSSSWGRWISWVGDVGGDGGWSNVLVEFIYETNVRGCATRCVAPCM